MRCYPNNHSINDDKANYCPICGLRLKPLIETEVTINKRIEKKVNQKTDWVFVQRHLCSARMKVKRYRTYKKKIAEVNIALNNDNVDQAIDSMYFDWSTEIKPDPIEGKLYYSDKVPPPWKTIEQEKEEARQIYRTKGIAGFQKLAQLYMKYHFKAENIDEMIKNSEDELKRIEKIVKKNSPERAAQLLRTFGSCHEIWAIKKAVLKADYGIDWLSPAERHPEIHFD